MCGTESLRQQMLATANSTADVLATVYRISDTEFVARMFSDLADYVQVDSRVAETFDFRSPIARMLDSLFASVYFHHIADNSHRPSASSSTSHHRPQQPQHYEQQQAYIGCVASARRQLDPPPLNDVEVRLSEDFKRSLNVTRLLIDAFDVAAETIRWTTGGVHEQPPTTSTSTPSDRLN